MLYNKTSLIFVCPPLHESHTQHDARNIHVVNKSIVFDLALILCYLLSRLGARYGVSPGSRLTEYEFNDYYLGCMKMNTHAHVYPNTAHIYPSAKYTSYSIHAKLYTLINAVTINLSHVLVFQTRNPKQIFYSI